MAWKKVKKRSSVRLKKGALILACLISGTINAVRELEFPDTGTGISGWISQQEQKRPACCFDTEICCCCISIAACDVGLYFFPCQTVAAAGGCCAATCIVDKIMKKYGYPKKSPKPKFQ